MKWYALARAFACAALALAPAAAARGADEPSGPGPAADPVPAAPDVPATLPSTQPARITPEARAMIDEVAQAYGKLKTLALAGAVSSDIEAGGRHKRDSQTFTASFEAPNRFRHAMKDDLQFGSTGEKVYAYLPSRNQYVSAAAPKDKVVTDKLPAPLPQALEMQDPSLMLAVSADPAKELTDNVVEAVKLADTPVGDAACPTLKLTLKDKTTVTLLTDPGTHLLRQVRTDLTPSLAEGEAAADVRSAVTTVDYTTVTPSAPADAEQFAWSPPPGAKELVAGGPGEDDSAAAQLAGKPAPDFKLQGMDGKDVSLADLKGSPVILDFWATWCGPCRASLPHLNALYDANKAAGLKVFAVNLKEEKDQVSRFVEQTKLTIPVLLDKEGDTAEKYKAEAIPETVLIGKDGTVKKVFIGSGHDDDLKAAIAAAMKE